MDFFADGGFQQLFCDLNEQLEQDYNNWQPQQFTNDRNNNKSNNKKVGCCLTTAYDENEANICLLDETLNNYSPQIMDLHEKELQTSLDYLLSNSRESLWDYESCLPSFSSVSKDLCDWEEKFLDNFIEIPELVDILPEKTPLCTDNCNHFLQESAKNLKLPAAVLNVNDVDVDADDKSYVCSFGDCHKVYAKPAHLKAHLRRHLGEKPYICDWPNCTWKFSRSDELARHRRSHSGVKPYKCDFCAKCFARSDHLTKHRKVHERRLLAASKAGKTLINGQLPASVLTVRPGRKKKNQL